MFIEEGQPNSFDNGKGSLGHGGGITDFLLMVSAGLRTTRVGHELCCKCRNYKNTKPGKVPSPLRSCNAGEGLGCPGSAAWSSPGRQWLQLGRGKGYRNSTSGVGLLLWASLLDLVHRLHSVLLRVSFLTITGNTPCKPPSHVYAPAPPSPLP